MRLFGLFFALLVAVGTVASVGELGETQSVKTQFSNVADVEEEWVKTFSHP